MSLKLCILFSNKKHRNFSNYSNNKSPKNKENKKKFDSLLSGYEEIKYSFLGVSGVYKLTNKLNTTRFYIGSSVNLSRRMGEYINLIKGIRLPQSTAELEISQISAEGNLSLEFLEITSPIFSLVFEQYALIKFKPTINKYFSVVPRINPQWVKDLDEAIKKINEFIELFPIDSLLLSTKGIKYIFKYRSS